MNRKELKTAINEILDNAPDSMLKDILEYLKSINAKNQHSIALFENLQTILNEDKELLGRLGK